MHHITLPYDLRPWRTYQRSVVQPYTQELLDGVLRTAGLAADRLLFRGGFGREEDLARLIITGSDYASAYVVHPTTGERHHATYAVPFGRIACEPWVRGLDPLYWALCGHGVPFNPVSAIVAYHSDRMITMPNSDVCLFRKLSTNAVAAILTLRLENK